MKTVYFLLAYLNWTIVAFAVIYGDVRSVGINVLVALWMTYKMMTTKPIEEKKHDE